MIESREPRKLVSIMELVQRLDGKVIEEPKIKGADLEPVAIQYLAGVILRAHKDPLLNSTLSEPEIYLFVLNSFGMECPHPDHTREPMAGSNGGSASYRCGTCGTTVVIPKAGGRDVD